MEQVGGWGGGVAKEWLNEEGVVAMKENESEFHGDMEAMQLVLFGVLLL